MVEIILFAIIGVLLLALAIICVMMPDPMTETHREIARYNREHPNRLI